MCFEAAFLIAALYDKFLVCLSGSARYYRSGETNGFQFFSGVA